MYPVPLHLPQTLITFFVWFIDYIPSQKSKLTIAIVKPLFAGAVAAASCYFTRQGGRGEVQYGPSLAPRCRAQIVGDKPDIAEHQNSDKINPGKPSAVRACYNKPQAEHDPQRPVVCCDLFHVFIPAASFYLSKIPL